MSEWRWSRAGCTARASCRKRIRTCCTSTKSNLLDEQIVDAILDAAAQEQYTVRHGPLAATYRSRLVLIGTMNPEEGLLRPQIQDRFGLRLVVRGLSQEADRLAIYQRAQAYRSNPYALAIDWLGETRAAAQEIVTARERLPGVELPLKVERLGLRWIRELKIDSHRTELALFEAARAYAAADSRRRVRERTSRHRTDGAAPPPQRFHA